MEGRLREMSAKSNALNMLVTGQSTADLRAGSDLAPDFYPPNYFQGTGAKPHGFGPSSMPDQITGGAYDPAGDIRSGATGVPPMQGQLPADVDLTSQFQTPEYEQGPPSDTKMSHIYKMLDMMQGRKKDPTESKVEQLRASGTRAGLTQYDTETMIQRMLGGLEKPATGTDKLSDTDLINFFGGKEGTQLDKGTQELLKELRPDVAGLRGRRGGRRAPAPPQITEAQVRRDFMEQWGLEPTSVEILADTIIVMVGTERYVLDRGE
jgi:hypothetical protein